jgi:hypothetical protein
MPCTNSDIWLANGFINKYLNKTLNIIKGTGVMNASSDAECIMQVQTKRSLSTQSKDESEQSVGDEWGLKKKTAKL